MEFVVLVHVTNKEKGLEHEKLFAETENSL